jgi:hypothetical protein
MLLLSLSFDKLFSILDDYYVERYGKYSTREGGDKVGHRSVFREAR